MKHVMEVRKVLSQNDLGKTGSHQAGMLIPRVPEILAFFPQLDTSAENPRAVMSFTSVSTGEEHSFSFIYYNNKKRGGTRNEYRLTRMTGYLRGIGAKPGDELVLSHSPGGDYKIDKVENSAITMVPDEIKLTGGWKVITLKKGNA